MITIEQFKQTVVRLGKLFPSSSPNFSDPEVARAFYEKIRDMEFENLQKACDLAAETRKWFPTIAELKELANGNPLTDDEVAIDLAIKIEKLIGLYGRNGMQDNNPFRQELIEKLGDVGFEIVKEFGGWENLCLKVEYKSEYKDFQKDLKNACGIKYKKLRAMGEDRPIALPQSAMDKKENKPAALLQALNLIDQKFRADNRGTDAVV